MKRIFITVLIFLPFALMAQTNETKKATAGDEKKKQAPKQEGFEMKQYFFVMLTRGARRNEITDTNAIKKIQEGHINNIDRLAALGKVVIAGPFGDDGNWRGLFVFNCPTKEEVEELLKSDPAIAAGRLAYEIHPWWTAKNCLFK